jgi:lipopolysaccharide biosynthesis protein
MPDLRTIAFYLPQYHPIPENDEWWGKGFTEWTNTAKARPLFRGHYQPRVPADLGFYDLRVPESRIAQAELARRYGVDAFCYYHYWFGGKRLLERPFNEVLSSGEPDFPFCLCWANQTWTGVWHGAPNRILVEQTYPGIDDHRAHFNTLLRAFTDTRYLTVSDKPLFMVYEPAHLPDVNRVTDLWRTWALEAGLRGLYLVGWQHQNFEWRPSSSGFDASVTLTHRPIWFSWKHPLKRLHRLLRKQLGRPLVYNYGDVHLDMLHKPLDGATQHPCVLPNWDNTPRSGVNGYVLHESTPELFAQQVQRALTMIPDGSGDDRLLFIKSWNEWAEGNHLEPDLRHGHGYLEALRQTIR